MKRDELQWLHGLRRKTERAAWALWKKAAKLPDTSKGAAKDCDKLFGLCCSLLYIPCMGALVRDYERNYRASRGMPAHACCEFARNALFLLSALRLKNAWEPRVLAALGERMRLQQKKQNTPGLTLTEAARIAGVSKSTITRHPIGVMFQRRAAVKTLPVQHDHDGATYDPEPQED